MVSRSLAYLQAAGGICPTQCMGTQRPSFVKLRGLGFAGCSPALSPTFLALALNLRAPLTITFILELPSSFYTSLNLENLLPSKASLRPPRAALPTPTPAKMVPSFTTISCL